MLQARINGRLIHPDLNRCHKFLGRPEQIDSLVVVKYICRNPLAPPKQDAASIEVVAKQLIEEFPDLNVLINNAGIIQPYDAAGLIDEDVLISTVATNLLGPIRLTSVLIDHLKSKKEAFVINTTSILGFVPLAATAVYSATKAALHTYTLAQRYLLKGTSVKVIEIVPP